MGPAYLGSMATDHRKLTAFNLADELTVRLYKTTIDFPVSERYGLRSQLRRATVSIATNIVEGCARDSDREHSRFFEIAFASAREVLYLIDLSVRLEMMQKEPASELHELARRAAAALAALRRSISN
jgi:four helix bundle protein